jgi:uncharacterized cupredoxin-like copper-binding protein
MRTIRPRPGTRRALALPAVVALLALAGCSKGSAAPATGGEKSKVPPGGISAVVKDFAITLDPSSGSAGTVTFNIRNVGPSIHEFVVLRSEATADDLPLNKKDAEVEEEGPGIEVVGEAEDIAPNASKVLTLTLEPGTYAIICNLTGHYQQGMWQSFTVE